MSQAGGTGSDHQHSNSQPNIIGKNNKFDLFHSMNINYFQMVKALSM